jgi:hypothetical protein
VKFVRGGSRVDSGSFEQPMDFTVMPLTQRQSEKRRVVAKTNVMLLNQLVCAAQHAP